MKTSPVADSPQQTESPFGATLNDFIDGIGTIRKCCPTHLKAAYGSIADSGEPSTRVYEFTPLLPIHYLLAFRR
jgi:hypothetical protein